MRLSQSQTRWDLINTVCEERLLVPINKHLCVCVCVSCSGSRDPVKTDSEEQNLDLMKHGGWWINVGLVEAHWLLVMASHRAVS